MPNLCIKNLSHFPTCHYYKIERNDDMKNFICICMLLCIVWRTETIQAEGHVTPTKSWDIFFSKQLNADEVNPQHIYIQTPSGELHPISIAQLNETALTITPLIPYKEEGRYTIHVNNVTSSAGEPLYEPFSYTFSFVPVEKATWIWDATTLTAENAQFLIDEHVTKVYVQVEPSIPNKQYAEFFHTLSQHSIKIYALEGFAALEWKNNEKTLRYLQWIVQFQQTYNYLDGIHVDIEHYTDPSWHTNQQQLIEQYFTYIMMLQQFSKQHTLRFEIDMPFWFDELTYENSFGSGNVAQWLINQTDEVTIMAYRNEAQAILPLVATEYYYAKSQHKSLTIAIETAPSQEGPGISFFDYSPSHLYEAMHMLHSTYDTPIAIHHLPSWQNLLK